MSTAVEQTAFTNVDANVSYVFEDEIYCWRCGFKCKSSWNYCPKCGAELCKR
ncbi:MAG: hypothetical protein DRJ47_08660 [Thermoprotei archaeon]|nr:MAG: hypothetical protein DRJ47_08660 [Thermoprotei archaeon]